MNMTFLALFLAFCPLCVVSQTLMESGPGTVRPSGTLKLTCTVSGFELTSYSIHWVRQSPGKGLEWLGAIWASGGTAIHDSLKNRISITKDNGKKQVYFAMTAMETKDTSVYYCARGGGLYASGYHYLEYWGDGTLVTVTTENPKAPSVFPLRPCCGSESSGTEVTVGCLISGYLPTPVNVNWNSGSITTGIKNFPAVMSGGLFTSSSQLIIPLSDWKTKTFHCDVEHTQTSFKVSKAIPGCTSKTSSPNVQVMQSSCGDSSGKDTVDLVCLISGYAPKDIRVQWLLNGEPTSIVPLNSTPFRSEEGIFESRSQVSVPKSDWNSGDTYTCKVIHEASSTKSEGNIRKCLESSSNPLPKVALYPPTPKDLLISKQGKVTCEVSKMESTESLDITWTRSDNKRPLQFTDEPQQQYDGTFTVKSVLKITPQDWNNLKEFTCTANHSELPAPVSKTIKKRNDITKEPVVYICPPAPEELNSNDFVRVTCIVKGFFPKEIYIQWKKNGVIQDENYYLNTEPILEEDEEYLMFSTLSVAKSDWDRGATFTCVAVHDKIIERDIKKSRGK